MQRPMPGDPAPTFVAASSVNATFNFDTVAGRYVVMSFFGSSQTAIAREFLAAVEARAPRFDVTNAMFFGVTADAGDVGRVTHADPGRLFFYDLDCAVARQYGIVGAEGGDYRCRTFVLDQGLRIVASLALNDDVAGHVRRIDEVLDTLPPLASLGGLAPVLIVPYVFEPALCRTLIDYYERTGGEDSGFMRDVGGKTVGLTDYSQKRRMDCEIADRDLVASVQERIRRRVVPAIRQAHQFDVTRIERHIVACYDAEQGAHFRAHRDNTTRGTAHRRFAVTINLNSPDYEGGEIWFPEFGPKRYKAPSGAAIVFSCSLLHEVPRVTRGKRYAFLPFLYDDAAAAIRERNRQYLGDLSGAAGGRSTVDCAAAGDEKDVPAHATKPMLDGRCGCGNPNGCGTCLSAPTYQLGVPGSS